MDFKYFKTFLFHVFIIMFFFYRSVQYVNQGKAIVRRVRMVTILMVLQQDVR
jgi:hypothetical protein